MANPQTTTAPTITLRRISAGHYQTPCGRFDVCRVDYDRNFGYGLSGWYWSENDAPGADDHFGTMRAARTALAFHMAAEDAPDLSTFAIEIRAWRCAQLSSYPPRDSVDVQAISYEAAKAKLLAWAAQLGWNVEIISGRQVDAPRPAGVLVK
jgi:hypothetical protein